ncbi:MAG: hypothetical protein NC452_15525 [Eubacterium sp.]|nr:hypothetical protein [Eubacterium sp.]
MHRELTNNKDINISLDNGKGHELPATMANLEMQTYYGTITEEEGFKYVIFALEPGELVNATLICPLTPDVDYDLLMYEFDMDQNTFGDLINYSMLSTVFNTYPDNTQKTADESLSYINETNETIYYALVVYATEGYSVMHNFILQLSATVNGEYDTFEPNDSPYYPTTISSRLNNLSLHAENDNDWFLYYATDDVAAVKISTNVIGYNVEIYTSDGSGMYLETPQSDGFYLVESDIPYYIHMFSNMNEFSPSNYGLTFETAEATPNEPEVGNIKISSFTSDLDSDIVRYDYGYLNIFKREFEVTVLVTSTDGSPLENQRVYLQWESDAWTEASGNRYVYAEGWTNSNGVVTLKVRTAVSLGSKKYILTGAVNFLHTYDLSQVTVYCGNASTTKKLYHFANSSYISS